MPCRIGRIGHIFVRKRRIGHIKIVKIIGVVSGSKSKG